MSKKNNKKRNSQNKKIVLIVVAAIVVFSLLVVSVTAITNAINKKRRDKTVKVAFYGLSQEYCDALMERFPKEEGISLAFEVLSDGPLDLGFIKNKYDMIFTWKGEVTDALEETAEELPGKILEVIPSSLQNKKCAPILLDNCEIAYNKEIVEKLGNSIPNNYPDFLNFLNDAKAYVFSPFFCSGADDRVITAFIGNIIEVLGGVDSYNLFIDEIKKGTSFEDLLDVQLSKAGLSLRSVLDPLKSWPGQGYTHPSWYNGTGNDLLYFAEENHTAAFFTFLHEHRQIQYNTISRYEAFLLPPASSTIKYGIIAPAISVMVISENTNAKRYVLEFFTEDAQMGLSDITRLAPVHSRAQAVDRQADDVRYWAAASPGGALPDVALAAFQRNPAALKEFAAKIRNYIK